MEGRREGGEEGREGRVSTLSTLAALIEPHQCGQAQRDDKAEPLLPSLPPLLPPLYHTFSWEISGAWTASMMDLTKETPQATTAALDKYRRKAIVEEEEVRCLKEKKTT